MEGVPGLEPTLKAVPLGFVSPVLEPKLKLPFELLRMSTPASPPLSVVGPVKV
jgi:hypothetical protein